MMKLPFTPINTRLERNMPDWKDSIELIGKNAIVLVRQLIYEDSDEYQYQLLQLFRLSETSQWSVDGPLVNMAADNFEPKDYDGFIVIENR
jgi:hypothetical protein